MLHSSLCGSTDYEGQQSNDSPCRATGADIPSELFALILRYAFLDCPVMGQTFFYIPNEDDRPTVRHLSEVNAFWAEHYRRVLFSKILRINSLKQARGLRSLILAKGSARFTCISQLIRAVEVYPKLPNISWLRILAALVPLIPPQAFGKMTLNPPQASDGSDLPPARLRSLGAWSIHPRFTPPLRELVLHELHFASVTDIVTLVNQLVHLETLDFHRLSWDRDARPAHHAIITAPRTHRLASIITSACQDDLRLWQVTTFRVRSSPLHLLSNFDQEILGRILGSVQSAYNNADSQYPWTEGPISTLTRIWNRSEDGQSFIASFRIPESLQGINPNIQPLDLFFNLHLICKSPQSSGLTAAGTHGSSFLQVIGCVVVTEKPKGDVGEQMSTAFVECNFGWWSPALQFSGLRHLTVAVDGFNMNDIRSLVEAHTELIHPVVRFVTIPGSEEELAVEVDSVTLEKTGSKWHIRCDSLWEKGQDTCKIAEDLFKQYYA